MDRFVYEIYLPWRLEQQERLDLEQKRAAAALGALECFGQPPAMEWLNQRNSLLRFSEVNLAVREGRVWVYFWVEPFGLEDLFAIGGLLFWFRLQNPVFCIKISRLMPSRWQPGLRPWPIRLA